MLKMSRIFKMKALYFVLFAGYGALGPYTALFFASLSLSPAKIGILTMLPNLCAFLVAPFFSYIGDKYNAPIEVLIVALVLSTVGNTLSLYMQTFTAQLAVVLATSIVKSPIGPQIDSVVMGSLQDKADYGSMRLWGAVSFGIFAFLGGLLTAARTEGQGQTEVQGGADSRFTSVFYVYAFSSMMAGFIILSLAHGGGGKVGSSSGGSGSSRGGDVEAQAATKTGAGTGTRVDEEASTIYTALIRSEKQQEQTQQKQQQQEQWGQAEKGTRDTASPSTASTSPTTPTSPTSSTSHTSPTTPAPPTDPPRGDLSALVQVFRSHPEALVFGLVVFLSGVGAGVIDSYLFLHLQELGGSGLVLGLARFITCAAEMAFVARFAYYSLLSQPWLVLPCEALNGLTFAVTWSVSCTYASQIAPPGCEGTMQALLEGLHFGVGAGAGSLLGGFAYEAFGAVRLFQMSGLLSLASSLLAGATWWCLRVGRVTPPKSPHYHSTAEGAEGAEGTEGAKGIWGLSRGAAGDEDTASTSPSPSTSTSPPVSTSVSPSSVSFISNPGARAAAAVTAAAHAAATAAKAAAAAAVTATAARPRYVELRQFDHQDTQDSADV
ncbi:major facilitator superfamily domain-containing protein [Ochromonadaceae sp. CCMP2298]|nr:major facilitator superfamily domain-containing protein [Ochromonadaceae sp. CCMP2298]